jgi:uncharacterized membrane protein
MICRETFDMPLGRRLLIFLASAAMFTLLDAIWLGVIGAKLYQDQIGPLLLQPFRLDAAIAFYLIYLAGVNLFAVHPALAAGRWQAAVWRGGALGFFAYATYDLTNLATLKGFTETVVVADMCWGVFVTASATFAGYWAGRLLSRRQPL